MPYSLVLIWMWTWLITLLCWLFGRQRPQSRPFARKSSGRPTWISPTTQFRRKPDWVIRELITIKAWTSNAGCRRIADTFNRRHMDDGFSVSKSYVANFLEQHGAAVMRLRLKLRRRKLAKPVQRYASWGMDTTFVTDADRRQRMLLGLVDHGTRACIALKGLGYKSASTIWKELIALFKQYGIPDKIRVDNERSFNAGWLRFALRLLGVEIHTTAPFSPLQNGKIERFFKSFRANFRRVVRGDLTQLLKEWRWFYVRPHMGIDYRTPVEAWNGRSRTCGEDQRISLWNGAQRALYFPD